MDSPHQEHSGSSNCWPKATQICGPGSGEFLKTLLQHLHSIHEILQSVRNQTYATEKIVRPTLTEGGKQTGIKFSRRIHIKILQVDRVFLSQ